MSSEVQVSSSPGRVVETDHLAPHADLLTLLKLLRSFSSESKKYWDLCVMEIYSDLIGERAKRARHSQVCSIEIADIYIIYILLLYIVRAIFVLITRKEGGA